MRKITSLFYRLILSIVDSTPKSNLTHFLNLFYTHILSVIYRIHHKSYFKIIKIQNKFINSFIKIEVDKNEIRDLFEKLFPYETENELIRVGSEIDGGYLIPNDDLKSIGACFSPGVGNKWNFEEKCYELGIKKIFLADASVNLSFPNSDFIFTKKFIGYKNKNKNFMTMEEWFKKSGLNENTDLLLQMDIEGREFEVINNIDEKLLKKFRIIVIEFHFLSKLWEKSFFKEAEKTFKKLLKNHIVVHIHPNNYGRTFINKEIKINETLEFTFIRKDRVKTKRYAKRFPHKLDRDNSKKMEKLILSKNLYKQN